jgi:hypothetical protein
MEERNRQNNYADKAIAGYSMINVMANISYAGMRAQGSDNKLARVLSFIIGFPGTFLSYFVVDEGSQRAYGVELPRIKKEPL